MLNATERLGREKEGRSLKLDEREGVENRTSEKIEVARVFQSCTQPCPTAVTKLCRGIVSGKRRGTGRLRFNL